MLNYILKSNIFKITTILFVIFVISCSNAINEEDDLYKIPVNKNDGWEISNLQQEGIDTGIIENLIKKIQADEYKNIHSLVIIKNGKLVLDILFKKALSVFDDDVGNKDIEVHAMFSVTKSILSILTGIAIDKGYLVDLTQNIYSFFPEYDKFDNWNDQKSLINIEHLLTMRHGLDWDEITYPYTDSRNSYYKMSQSKDWVKYFLDLPSIKLPNEEFAYSSGASHTIGKLLANISGIKIEEFAENNLFTPLQIKKSIWNRAGNGIADDVYLTTRNMAKIGQLIINGGVWGDKRIVSEKWVDEIVKWKEKLGDSYGYSYFWWKFKFEYRDKIIDATVAWGYGGQFIFVLKELDAVICFTSGNYNNNDLAEQPFEIIRRYILPSIK